MLEQLIEDFQFALQEADTEAAFRCIHTALDSGISAEGASVKIVAPALTMIFNAVVNQQAVLSQHYMATKISNEIIDELYDQIPKESFKPGTVLIGTAPGDFHGLGKK